MASKETSRETDPAAGDHATGDKAGTPAKPGGAAKGSRREPPDWSHGLRQFYDSVVEEDLPDSFKDLLDKLDQTDPNEVGGTKDHHPPRTGGVA